MQGPLWVRQQMANLEALVIRDVFGSIEEGIGIRFPTQPHNYLIRFLTNFRRKMATVVDQEVNLCLLLCTANAIFHYVQYRIFSRSHPFIRWLSWEVSKVLDTGMPTTGLQAAAANPTSCLSFSRRTCTEHLTNSTNLIYLLRVRWKYWVKLAINFKQQFTCGGWLPNHRVMSAQAKSKPSISL